MEKKRGKPRRIGFSSRNPRDFYGIITQEGKILGRFRTKLAADIKLRYLERVFLYKNLKIIELKKRKLSFKSS